MAAVASRLVDSLSLSQARRIALYAQGFGDKRPTGRIDKRHLRKVMGRINLLQLDSIPVIIRTQYMPLFSRLGPYRPELLDEIAYAGDEWIEAWTHEASLIPAETEPLLRWARNRAEQGWTWKGLYDFANDNAEYVEKVYREVEERGPLTASALEEERRRTGDWWSGRSDGRLALDWLFRIGRVGIRRQGNFGKVWDTMDRIVPAVIQAVPTPDEGEAQRELALRSASAHGVGTAQDLADYYRMPIKDTRVRLAELVEDGRLTEVAVEGWNKPAFLHPNAKLPRWINGTSLVSPFDPVVWNRDRASRLFNFDYKIEIYVPAAKRKYGYYVLPFRVGEEIVARVDLKTDRAERTLRVQSAHLEPGQDPTAVANELTAELQRLAQLVGVDRVHIVDRGDLAPYLS